MNLKMEEVSVATDPMKGITVTSSTAGSLTSLGLSLGMTALAPYPIERAAERRPTVKRAPSDHPIYALVGRVASGFAHLEHVLDLIIWDLTGIDASRVACITAQINGSRPRYAAIISLLKQRKAQAFDDLAKEVEKLMKKTFDHAERRNRIVHDPWYVTDDEAKLTAQFRSMPTKDPQFGICAVDEKELTDVIQIADDLASAAGDLREEIRAALRL
jgi:hypothetical protein